MSDRFQVVHCQGKLSAFSIIVDTETGVNYLSVKMGPGLSITPLLDSEGKPIISELDKTSK